MGRKQEEHVVNISILVGRLGKDPEVRYTPDGMMIVNISVATDESWKNKAGEKQTKTEWHRVVIFGKLAEIVAKYCLKGQLIFIQGRIQTRAWEDKDGVKRYITETVATTIKMLSKGNGNGNGNGAPPQGEDTGFPDQPLSDEDVPF